MILIVFPRGDANEYSFTPSIGDLVTLDSCQQLRPFDFKNLLSVVCVKWYLTVILMFIFLVTKKLSIIL